MNATRSIAQALMLVNIVGSLAICLLVGSILLGANRKHQDVQRLDLSLSIRQNISEAYSAIVQENAILWQQSYPPSSTAQSWQQSADVSSKASTEKLALVISDLYTITEHQKYTTKISLAPENLIKVRERLENLSKELITLQVSPDARLLLVHENIRQLLRRLAADISYRPNQASSVVINHYELLTEQWRIHELFLQQVTKQNPIDTTRAKIPADQLDGLIQLSKSNGVNPNLSVRVQELVDIYRGPSQVLSGSLTSIVSDVQQKHTSLHRSSNGNLQALLHESSAANFRTLVLKLLNAFMFMCVAGLSIIVNRKINFLAFHDTLTSLPNRLYLESRLENLQRDPRKVKKDTALFFIDLDRFKVINDNYGHSVGDELLKNVALRLTSCCESKDVLARLGGDEFAVLREDCGSTESETEFANEMVNELCSDFFIQQTSLSVGASVGISMSPRDCEAGPDLLKNADIAMYHSKSNKLAQVEIFNAEMANKYQERISIELALRQSIARNQLKLHYQPKVDCATGRVAGVEALLRWEHPEWGMISPAVFVPIAEDTGLMGGIGKWVINKSFEEIGEFNRNNDSTLSVAVNISVQQCSDKSFVDDVFCAIATSGLSPNQVELEVTESVLMNDISTVNTLLQTLKARGITIAIDDFGTGYSSLQYLQELALDVLKIDRAFINALDKTDPRHSVANSIVQLARTLNLKTVAEGVETPLQEEKVRSLGVDMIQGFLYSKPIAQAELEDQITRIEADIPSPKSNLDNAA